MIITRWLVAVLVLACCSSGALAANCGGNNQKPCTISEATKVGNKPSSCPKGSFFDPIDGGTCWECPEHNNRTAYHVKSDKACVRPSYEKFKKADKERKNTRVGQGCPKGQFWDVKGGDGLLGACYDCGSYNRTAYPVDHDRSCVKRVKEELNSAKLVSSLSCPDGSFFDLIDGGTCWKCPKEYSRSATHVKSKDACVAAPFAGLGAAFGACDEGYLNIRGTCRKQGDCGKNGERPCLLGERIPSCDDGLKENFQQNVCVPLAPGELPFFAGLASLADFYGDGIVLACRQALGPLNLKSETDLAAGANCTKNIVAGASCELLADKMGRGATKAVSMVLSVPATAARFNSEVDKAYKKDCAGYKENLTKARNHGAAKTFMTCGEGEFWDFNGNCYSCPKGHNRTLYPVDTDKACVDTVGGNLIRSACSVYKATDNMFVQSNKCTIEVLRNGEFLNEPLDVSDADREVCMAVGELSYGIYDLIATAAESPQVTGARLETRLSQFISVVKKNYKYASVAAKAATVAEKGKKLKDMAECR